MNCEDMVNMPELTGVLNLKAGEFRVIEFAYHNDRQSHHDDSLTAGQAVRRIINTEFSYYLSENILVQLQLKWLIYTRLHFNEQQMSHDV